MIKYKSESRLLVENMKRFNNTRVAQGLTEEQQEKAQSPDRDKQQVVEHFPDCASIMVNVHGNWLTED